jgi:hypothetical protein
MSSPEHVETWKGIAALCDRSERWCRYMARDRVNPLPVYKIGGMVRLNVADYRRWESSQRPTQRPVSSDWPLVHHDHARCAFVCTACGRTIMDDSLVEIVNYQPVSHVGCPALKEVVSEHDAG